MCRTDEPLRTEVEARPRCGDGQALDERTREPRRAPDSLGEQVCGIGVVAAEQLVAALARQGYLDRSRGELGDEIGGQRRRVRERLVERLGERR